MLDILYVAGAIAFFAVMLLYVHFFRRLGGSAEATEERHDA